MVRLHPPILDIRRCALRRIPVHINAGGNSFFAPRREPRVLNRKIDGKADPACRHPAEQGVPGVTKSPPVIHSLALWHRLLKPKLRIQRRRFPVCNQAYIARFRQFLLNEIHQPDHNFPAQSPPLKGRVHTNIYDLAEATAIPDNAAHADDFIVVFDDDRVEGIVQPDLAGDFRLFGKPANIPEVAVIRHGDGAGMDSKIAHKWLKKSNMSI